MYDTLGVVPAAGLLLYPKEATMHFSVCMLLSRYSYGPPGTGKTLIAKALAAEAQVPFIYMNIASLVKSLVYPCFLISLPHQVGESEKELATVFARARRCERCILFFDELETVFGIRDMESGADRV